MNIGDTFKISLGYHGGGMMTTKSQNEYRFKVVEIIKDNMNEKKDLMVCEEMDYGYKECFHRIDLEGKK